VAFLESVRKTLAVGAEPLAITNCINYGDPDTDPEGLAAMMRALKDACEFSGIAVASGNASLYYTYMGKGIPPTLVIGVIGRVDPERVIKPKPSKAFAVGWPDFVLEREKDLWKVLKKVVHDGGFVISAMNLINSTHREALRRMGLMLKVEQLPSVSPVHQMFIVFTDSLKLNVPFREIGSLLRMG